MPSMSRINIRATYLVRCTPQEAPAWADAIRVEQSVEMPLAGIAEERILRDIVGEVLDIAPAPEPAGDACGTRMRIVLGLAAATARPGIAQLMNMLIGNTSLHEKVELADAELPDELLQAFSGPRHGIAGLRRLTGVERGPITCTALKPQGMGVADLARLCHTLAASGMHIIKDDHGLSDQAYAPFAQRLQACQAAVLRANRETGLRALYAPSLSGTPAQVREQARLAREEGVKLALLAPMLMGLPAFEEAVREHLDCAVLAHPALGGLRIAPELLFGKIYRLLGADAVIFTGYGGRFAYTRERCQAIARACTAPLGGLLPAMPVPAGGMKLERVEELVDCYGQDTMLLIGGDLLIAREHLLERGRQFAARVASVASVASVAGPAGKAAAGAAA